MTKTKTFIIHLYPHLTPHIHMHSNLANTASLLWHAYHALPSPLSNVNWAGFYVLDPSTPDQLILGPFHGKVACQTIRFGRGVVGTAVSRREVIRVDDVALFKGHIACDGASRSEIVVPIFAGEGDSKKNVIAVVDVDCELEQGFDELDVLWLEKLADLIGRSCDW